MVRSLLSEGLNSEDASEWNPTYGRLFEARMSHWAVHDPQQFEFWDKTLKRRTQEETAEKK